MVQTRMPMGIAGVQRYEESESKISFAPGNVIIMCITVAVMVLAFHLFL